MRKIVAGLLLCIAAGCDNRPDMRARSGVEHACKGSFGAEVQVKQIGETRTPGVPAGTPGVLPGEAVRRIRDSNS